MICVIDSVESVSDIVLLRFLRDIIARPLHLGAVRGLDGIRTTADIIAIDPQVSISNYFQWCQRDKAVLATVDDT